MDRIRVGSIVEIVGRNAGGRWVVSGLYGSPSGWPPTAQLIRPASGEQPTGFTTSAASLVVVEEPHFANGERVGVGKLRGTVERTLEDGRVDVLVDAHRKALLRGGHVEVPAGHSMVPVWQLVLENRL